MPFYTSPGDLIAAWSAFTEVIERVTALSIERHRHTDVDAGQLGMGFVDVCGDRARRGGRGLGRSRHRTPDPILVDANHVGICSATSFRVSYIHPYRTHRRVVAALLLAAARTGCRRGQAEAAIGLPALFEPFPNMTLATSPDALGYLDSFLSSGHRTLLPVLLNAD
ncbi:hypothetical protein ACFVYA_29705 [Amycolatopsis sp. NPDC058278]|uniref:hypothetical protein n=1 Tax=Amycolatopsis sp. NPDC058278 TaxID=3346417 RepID=UPI0036DBD958